MARHEIHAAKESRQLRGKIGIAASGSAIWSRTYHRHHRTADLATRHHGPLTGQTLSAAFLKRLPVPVRSTTIELRQMGRKSGHDSFRTCAPVCPSTGDPPSQRHRRTVNRRFVLSTSHAGNESAAGLFTRSLAIAYHVRTQHVQCGEVGPHR